MTMCTLCNLDQNIDLLGIILKLSLYHPHISCGIA